MIPDAARDVMNHLAGQLVVLILIIGIAYAIPYLLLSLIRVPAAIRNLIATLVMLAAIYFSFDKLFL
ncbi:hypothetical protein [Sporosarcina sp. USHLN248]|uniref:hypothetical protein n=1 Tax=Sporosarcina sp. USHLN248 TaxID=3081300 RepID=UPI00301AD267